MRLVMCTAALVLTSAAAAADDPKPVRPAQPALQPPGGLQPRPVPVAPAQLMQLEEDLEMAEAARDVRKAHVKLAELGVRAAEVDLERLTRLAAGGAITKEEAEKAKVMVEVAKAQLEIRVAELKEVEVKVKYAKKRLDEAKRGGVRPVPPPVRPGGPDKVIEELRVQLVRAEINFEQSLAELLRVEAIVALTEADLARAREAAKFGRIRAGTLEAAESKFKDAKEQAERARKEHKEVIAALAAIHTKLKELEK
jgi:multidrug resistance efflux pump